MVMFLSDRNCRMLSTYVTFRVVHIFGDNFLNTVRFHDLLICLHSNNQSKIDYVIPASYLEKSPKNFAVVKFTSGIIALGNFAVQDFCRKTISPHFLKLS